MEQDTTSVFDLIVWGGAIVTLAGLVMLVWCILRVARVRKAAQDEDLLKAELEKVVPMNLGALFLSVIGLMMVVIGLALG